MKNINQRSSLSTDTKCWLMVAGVAGTVFSLALLAGLGSFTSYRISNAAAIDRLESAIRKNGEPLTLLELASTYPPIAEEGNGAARLLKVWEQDDPSFWQAFLKGKRPLPTRAKPHWDPALPLLGSSQKYLPAILPLNKTNIEAAEYFLQSRQEHFEAVRAALKYSHFRFSIELTNGFATLLPHLALLREEACSFQIEAMIDVEQGKVAEALTALDNVAAIGNTLTAEPLLISQLVRISCYRFTIEGTENLLSRHALSTDELQRLSILLDQLQMPDALRISLISERVIGLNFFTLPLKTLANSGASDDTDSDQPSDQGYKMGDDAWQFTGLKDADHRFLLETLGEALGLADNRSAEALDDYEKLFENVEKKGHHFPQKFVSALLLPALGRVKSRFATLEANRRDALVAIALEQYRVKNNHALPEKLDSLVPEFLPSIPNDPFDDQPLRYRPLPVGFVVYSIGQNRLDDGGKQRNSKDRSTKFDETFIVNR